MNWENIIVLDEKHLNLDDPDCCNCYFYNLRKTKDIRWSKLFKSGSLMFLESVSANGKIDLVVVSSSMNTEAYIKITCPTFSIV